MLTIKIRPELFDEESQKFVTSEDYELHLEHSLVSLSKWESKHEKPYLGKDAKSSEEVLSYIQAMVIDDDVPPDFIYRLSTDNIQQIDAYLNAKYSATWFNDTPNAPKSSEVITSELIYYWMTVYQIPIECERWHLNRLFNLIKICNLKNQKPKKMSRSEMAARNRELNAQRRAQLGTRG